MIEPVATLPLFLLLLTLFGILILVLEIRALSYAYRAIGISPRYLTAVLLFTLLGSHVNIPLTTGRVGNNASIVAINIGGALIPALVSLYLFGRSRRRGRMLMATAIVTVVVYRLATIVPGVGIAVPMLIPPLMATGVALLVSFREAPSVAYVAGSLGALIGADLLNLPRIIEIGAPIVAIGGAGTFDGVFLSGILAGVLAAWIAPPRRDPVIVESPRSRDRAA
ncbi:MAG TPA: DUF1614 domain-containing protein [Methylomirabilota bacterium]|nr:DUF1614 domain-containing protein [Methylomirabilota bacterium]